MMSLGEKQFGVAKSPTSSSTRPRNGRAFALQIVLVKIGSDVTGTARERSCVESVSQSDSCHLAGTRNHHPRRKTMIYKRGKVYWYKFGIMYFTQKVEYNDSRCCHAIFPSGKLFMCA